MKILIIIISLILISGCGSNISKNAVSPEGNKCPDGYPIKGNLTSQSGDKIYHRPGQQYYNKTTPEECFKTPEDAKAAGYRPSKR